jgi:hypothetical protein
MTCHAHRGAILDIARGVPLPTAEQRAAEAHLLGCAPCTAELRTQRELTYALRELAAASELSPGASALEGKLVDVFTAQHAPERPAVQTTASGYWWRAAAAVMLIASGLAGLILNRSARREDAAVDTVRIERRNPAAESGAPAAQTIGTAPAASVASGAVSPTGTAVTKTARGRPQRPAPVRTVEFIAIPSAVGLPSLESATIVRTQLPLSALPDYGLQISPSAAHAVLEADLLVGQDGLPRGIRLVTAADRSSTSRSRP